MQSFSDRLKEAMLDANMKQVELADHLESAQAYISQIINGKKIPSDRMAKQMADVLKVNPEWLINGEGPKNPDPSREQLIAETVANVLNDKPGSFQERVIKLLASLTYEEKVLLENIINTLSGKEDEKK